MDLRLIAMIALAHARLRQLTVQHYPHLIDEERMAKLHIRKPMELAGLKDPLARAERQEKAIHVLAERYNAVQNGIDECVEASTEYVGDLEQYHGALRRKIEGMVVPSNGNPTDGQDGQGSSGDQKVGQQVGQVIEGVKVEEGTKVE